MASTITEYELYSDERYDHLAEQRFLFLGGVVCTDRRRELLQEKFFEVRQTFGLTHEMRWGKVSKAYLDAYKAWTNVFYQDPHTRFSLLKVNRSGTDWRNFRPDATRRPKEDDKLVSVFYQFLLNTFGPLRDSKRWWVFHDAGFFSKDEVLNRVEFLFNRTYKKAFGSKTSRTIRLARAVDSAKSDLTQLADLILAATTAAHLGKTPTSWARRNLLKHCIKREIEHPKTQRNLPKIVIDEWVLPDKFQYRY